MTLKQREKIVHRLLYGEYLFTIRGIQYKLVQPSPKIKVMADLYYDETIRKNRFGTWLKDRDCIAILVKNGLCSPNIDENIKKISERIDDLKVELYENLFKQTLFEKTQKTLNMVKAKHEEMIRIRHMLDHLTLNGYAEMVRRQFIICKTLYYAEKNMLVWDDIDNIDYDIMELVIHESIKNVVGVTELREIARTDPWKSLWNVSKGNPFSVPIGELTDEQKTVILFSQMYDNIAKHPECPPDDIIENDDLLDGWMIRERRKKEKDQMSKQIDERIGHRHGESDELYIVAQGDTKEKRLADINRINSLNTVEGKIIKAQRKQQLNKMGKVIDAQFVDRKLQIQQASNEQFINTVKGK